MFKDSSKRDELNVLSPFEGVAGEIELHKNQLRATYDFAVQGGAIGTVNLKDSFGKDAVIPKGAVISRVLVDVVTAPTSLGSATVALQSAAAADLLAATAIASITGQVDGKPDGTASKCVKLSADKTLKAVIAVAALTAGKFHVFVDFARSE